MYVAFGHGLHGLTKKVSENATYGFEKIKSELLTKGHPCGIFSTFILSPWSPCQKRRPQVNFFALSETLFVSPWSPCRNATYISSEKIYSVLHMKDHPGEILSYFGLSLWSQCKKWQQWVNSSELFITILLNFSVKLAQILRVCWKAYQVIIFLEENIIWMKEVGLQPEAVRV